MNESVPWLVAGAAFVFGWALGRRYERAEHGWWHFRTAWRTMTRSWRAAWRHTGRVTVWFAGLAAAVSMVLYIWGHR